MINRIFGTCRRCHVPTNLNHHCLRFDLLSHQSNKTYTRTIFKVWFVRFVCDSHSMIHQIILIRPTKVAPQINKRPTEIVFQLGFPYHEGRTQSNHDIKEWKGLRQVLLIPPKQVKQWLQKLASISQGFLVHPSNLARYATFNYFNSYALNHSKLEPTELERRNHLNVYLHQYTGTMLILVRGPKFEERKILFRESMGTSLIQFIGPMYCMESWNASQKETLTLMEALHNKIRWNTKETIVKNHSSFSGPRAW